MNQKSEPVYSGSTFTRVAFAEALATFYFGSSRDGDLLGRYIDRAYRDMNRTLRLAALDRRARGALRAAADSVMRGALNELALGEVEPVATAFDAWHKKTCDALKSTYAAAGIAFTYGQAQKWVNMTLKYVFVALALDVLAPSTLRRYYSCAHMPIDSIVLSALRAKGVVVSLPGSAWSRSDDYGAYMTLQAAVRERFGSGLDAELMLWRPAYEEWDAEVG